MSKKLINIHKNKTGKVSDKWFLYLKEYEDILSAYREKNINLLAIQYALSSIC